jgi:hypothetical protein
MKEYEYLEGQKKPQGHLTKILPGSQLKDLEVQLKI